MSIQKMRLLRGWSQQQLADASGLGARTIQRIEAGYPASTESLKSLGAVFEVNFNTLKSELNMNSQTTSNQEIEERLAFKRVRRLKDFYSHVFVYLTMNICCIALNLLTTPDYLWFFGMTVFWGMGLLIHALRVYVVDKHFGAEWERTMVERLIGRSL